MTFDFTVKEFILGNGTGTPTLQFYRRGFNLGGSGSQPSWQDVILSGNTALTLVNSKADGLNYLKLFGGTEQRNIPSEYTQLDWVYNNAATSIDTGIRPTIDDVEFEIRTTGPSGSWYIFQSRETSATSIYGLSGSSNGDTIILTCGSYSIVSNITRTGPNTFYTIKGSLKNGVSTLYVKNETTGVEDTVTGIYNYSAPTTNIYLYGNSAGRYAPSGSKVSYARLKVGGEYVMNYTSAKEGSTLGFYDSVSNSLKTATAGSLTAGSNATPSPTTPMDIVCNNGVVKALINHWDMTKISGSAPGFNWNARSVAFDGTLSLVVANESSSARIQITLTAEQLGLQAGKTYTVKAWILDGNAFGNSEQTSQQIYVNGSYVNLTTGGTQTELTHTWTQAGTDDVKVGMFYVKNYGLGSTVRVRVMVTEGGTIGDYIPYTQPTIYTDGTVETVQVTGKNLFDGTYIDGYYINSSGEVLSGVTNRNAYTNAIKVIEGSSYTFSGISGYTSSSNRIHGYNGTSTNDWVQQIDVFSSISGDSFSDTFTIPNGVSYIRISTTIPLNTNQQLELGSTATTYEPYFNGGTAIATDLLAVGDYKDIQSVLDGAVTKNIGIYVVKGTESWNTGNDVGTNGYLRFNMTIDENKASGFDVLSNCFASKTSSIVGVNESSALISGHGTSASIFISIPASILSGDLTTVAGRRNALNAWFSAQYNAGTPVIIVYPLATATTSSVTAQPLTIQAGTNIVQITQASISNLPLEVSYKAGVTVTVTEIENAQLDNSVEVTVNG